VPFGQTVHRCVFPRILQRLHRAGSSSSSLSEMLETVTRDPDFQSALNEERQGARKGTPTGGRPSAEIPSLELAGKLSNCVGGKRHHRFVLMTTKPSPKERFRPPRTPRSCHPQCVRAYFCRLGFFGAAAAPHLRVWERTTEMQLSMKIAARWDGGVVRSSCD
jgi:hypothetical protein